MPRGRLRVYLGVAPGAGKTHALLDEARRRAARGNDVVVAAVATRDRPGLDAVLAGLESGWRSHRGRRGGAGPSAGRGRRRRPARSDPGGAGTTTAGRTSRNSSTTASRWSPPSTSGTWPRSRTSSSGSPEPGPDAAVPDRLLRDADQLASWSTSLRKPCVADWPTARCIPPSRSTPDCPRRSGCRSWPRCGNWLSAGR